MLLSSSSRGKEIRARFAALAAIAVFMGLRYGAFVAYHTMMTTNDKGRDFYVSDLILKGQLPYRHFDWPYGPAAPFYYAAWYKLLGTSILSYSVGELVASLAAAFAVFYLGLEVVGMPLALACPMMWTFITGARGHSGNYILCIFCAAVSLLAAVRIIKGRGDPDVHAVVIATFCGLLTLLKLNTGLAWAFSLCAVLAAWRLFEAGKTGAVTSTPPRPPRPAVMLAAGAAALLVVLAVYACLVMGLKREYLVRCFPFASGYHHKYGGVMKYVNYNIEFIRQSQSLADLLSNCFRACALNYFLIMSPAAFLILYRAIGRKFRGPDDWTLLLLTAALFVSSHEFLISGSWYSLYYVPGIVMATLPLVLSHRFFIWLFGNAGGKESETAARARRFSRRCAAGLTVALALAASWLLVDLLGELHQPGFYYLPMPRGKVWHQAFFEEAKPWSETVTEIVNYIEKNTRPDEPILVVPFDPLHLFLSDRRQVCRTVDFSRYQNITEQEEREIAQLMEQNRVRLVVWTNTTVIMDGKPAERFGYSHCVRLGEYILENYEQAAEIGEGFSTAGMSFAMHGARIFKRKTPFTSGAGL